MLCDLPTSHLSDLNPYRSSPFPPHLMHTGLLAGFGTRQVLLCFWAFALTWHILPPCRHMICSLQFPLKYSLLDKSVSNNSSPQLCWYFLIPHSLLFSRKTDTMYTYFFIIYLHLLECSLHEAKMRSSSLLITFAQHIVDTQ